MARCPFATWRPIPETSTEPVITVRCIVFHTAWSKSSSLWGYFERADVNVESHFYVQANGGVEQYVDTTRQADAQFDGNAYAISVESWDDASFIPWTPTQLESNARLAAWAHKTHGVELVKAYKHRDGTIHGIGYHAQFTQEWNRDNHACPGAPRIAQMPALIARAVQLAAGPTVEDELMALTVKNPLTGDQWAAADALWSIWKYAIDAAGDAAEAKKLATEALAAVKAHAAQPEPLDEAQTEAAVQAALETIITGAVVQLQVTQPASDSGIPVP